MDRHRSQFGIALTIAAIVFPSAYCRCVEQTADVRTVVDIAATSQCSSCPVPQRENSQRSKDSNPVHPCKCPSHLASFSITLESRQPASQVTLDFAGLANLAEGPLSPLMWLESVADRPGKDCHGPPLCTRLSMGCGLLI